MVSGVAQVQVFGSAKYAVRVQVDPAALAYRHIGIDDIANAINAQSVTRPDRRALGPRNGVHAPGERPTKQPAKFREMTVVYRNGAAVHLGALGHVLDDVQNNRSASWFNGVRRDRAGGAAPTGTNTVEVANAVRSTLIRCAPTSSERRKGRNRSSTVRSASINLCAT